MRPSAPATVPSFDCVHTGARRRRRDALGQAGPAARPSSTWRWCRSCSPSRCTRCCRATRIVPSFAFLAVEISVAVFGVVAAMAVPEAKATVASAPIATATAAARTHDLRHARSRVRACLLHVVVSSSSSQVSRNTEDLAERIARDRPRSTRRAGGRSIRPCVDPRRRTGRGHPGRSFASVGLFEVEGDFESGDRDHMDSLALQSTPKQR